MARTLGVLATVALSFACGGCSFLFADAAPEHHEKMLYFDCTSTPGLEVADGSLALLNGLAGVSALSQTEAEYQNANGKDANRNAAATVSFVGAGLFAGSAIYGIIVTENCSDAKAELRLRIMERERKAAERPAAAPAPLPPPVPPPAAVPPAAPAAAPPPALPAAPPPAAPPAAAPAPAAPAPAPAPAPPKPGTGSF
ncbi:MAG TPA: hypothetical protein VF103_07705 [Polyangiaceae bacterium]